MARVSDIAVRTELPTATPGETLAILSEVIVPTLAKGVIIRRPPVVAAADRLDLDRRAIRRVQGLRDKYGSGPLLLRTPVRTQALILDPAHVHRVLDESPEPFATASGEKRAALSHFQPRGVLISHGAERADRRRYNEQVLDTGSPMHRLAERFGAVVREEAELLLGAVRHREELAWADFALAWFRVVRRVVFGDAARDDYELTTMIGRLRGDANWAFFKPRRRGLRDQFYARMGRYLAQGDPQSLAGVMAATHATSLTAPSHQVPQWLFAFDPAGMTTFRALALLATHPEPLERVRAELRERAGHAQPDLPYLRACVLESLRLWPTTPMVLRQTTRPTEWEQGMLPARAGVLIYAPFFHRDEARLPEANSFAPELWLRRRDNSDYPLIPFSGGPAMCPGRNLVLLVSSAMLASLLDGRSFRLSGPPRLGPARPLPATLDNYGLRFAPA
ncbi:MAG TPA: cytochrome P450 [Chloroflexaceae bacterium]|nr:cytochrome P450 [Chloroflexaceae bacterium]